ncbi:uncharacterized protein LOC143019601 [Oratosquilla oratoria]|uniref:uncharacterized protein LOC143019601 n=1 Tax=Oratosquilla oratoria TaxID=337810 RepID=UPI003F768566
MATHTKTPVPDTAPPLLTSEKANHSEISSNLNPEALMNPSTIAMNHMETSYKTRTTPSSTTTPSNLRTTHLCSPKTGLLMEKEASGSTKETVQTATATANTTTTATLVLTPLASSLMREVLDTTTVTSMVNPMVVKTPLGTTSPMERVTTENWVTVEEVLPDREINSDTTDTLSNKPKNCNLFGATVPAARSIIGTQTSSHHSTKIIITTATLNTNAYPDGSLAAWSTASTQEAISIPCSGTIQTCYGSENKSLDTIGTLLETKPDFQGVSDTATRENLVTENLGISERTTEQTEQLILGKEEKTLVTSWPALGQTGAISSMGISDTMGIALNDPETTSERMGTFPNQEKMMKDKWNTMENTKETVMETLELAQKDMELDLNMKTSTTTVGEQMTAAGSPIHTSETTTKDLTNTAREMDPCEKEFTLATIGNMTVTPKMKKMSTHSRRVDAPTNPKAENNTMIGRTRIMAKSPRKEGALFPAKEAKVENAWHPTTPAMDPGAESIGYLTTDLGQSTISSRKILLTTECPLLATETPSLTTEVLTMTTGSLSTTPRVSSFTTKEIPVTMEGDSMPMEELPGNTDRSSARDSTCTKTMMNTPNKPAETSSCRRCQDLGPQSSAPTMTPSRPAAVIPTPVFPPSTTWPTTTACSLSYASTASPNFRSPTGGRRHSRSSSNTPAPNLHQKPRVARPASTTPPLRTKAPHPPTSHLSTPPTKTRARHTSTSPSRARSPQQLLTSLPTPPQRRRSHPLPTSPWATPPSTTTSPSRTRSQHTETSSPCTTASLRTSTPQPPMASLPTIAPPSSRIPPTPVPPATTSPLTPRAPHTPNSSSTPPPGMRTHLTSETPTDSLLLRPTPPDTPPPARPPAPYEDPVPRVTSSAVPRVPLEGSTTSIPMPPLGATGTSADTTPTSTPPPRPRMPHDTSAPFSVTPPLLRGRPTSPCGGGSLGDIVAPWGWSRRSPSPPPQGWRGTSSGRASSPPPNAHSTTRPSRRSSRPRTNRTPSPRPPLPPLPTAEAPPQPAHRSLGASGAGKMRGR